MKSAGALFLGIMFLFGSLIVHFTLHSFNDFYEYKGIHNMPLDNAYNLQEKYGMNSIDIVDINGTNAVVSIDICTDEENVDNMKGIPLPNQPTKVLSYVILSIGGILSIAGIIGLCKPLDKAE